MATLEAQKRETFGKNEAKRLRAGGRVPAVLYGPAQKKEQDAATAAVPIEVDPKALMRILHSDSGMNTLISLKLDGSDTHVLVRECQLDPITHKPLHVDFYSVAMDKVITVTVPIVLKGEPRGVKQQGGLLDFVHREIEVECLPSDIPEHIDVDVSELMLGQGVRVRDLARDARWKAVSDADTMLAHVVTPKAEEVPAEEAAVVAAPAEPEVIKKGKVEKAEEEA